MEQLSERDRAVLNMIFDPLEPLGLSSFSSEIEQEPKDENTDNLEPEVLELLKKAIASAEAKNLEESVELFEKAHKKAPNSPSILNDRAQAFRLFGKNEEALEDLNMAVKLSEGKGKAGIQALCQRGLLYLNMNQEEKAKDDFKLAAKGGSTFARSQLVSLNPYAAMCNAMLKEITLKSNSS
ncbi:tetratricopeptide repeat protein 36 [Prorops nasuta]|uniref:tetratricopeptide repeat protein 36 n=1 Tax=Prorops nasuta TaxID=863751 RepID=UPI0034CF7133